MTVTGRKAPAISEVNHLCAGIDSPSARCALAPGWGWAQSEPENQGMKNGRWDFWKLEVLRGGGRATFPRCL